MMKILPVFRHNRALRILALLALLGGPSGFIPASAAYAQNPGGPGTPGPAPAPGSPGGDGSGGGGGDGGGADCGSCCPCAPAIEANHKRIRDHVKAEFEKHRQWMTDIFWKEHILPAMQLMTLQMSAVAMKQVEIVGRLLDAKDQLETQRTFQVLTAEANRDYQPSEGMCEFGTNVRALAASERLSVQAQVALAQRMVDRQLATGKTEAMGGPGGASDKDSRKDQFRKTYCNPADNNNGLGLYCEGTDPERQNKDVDWYRTVESRLTIDADVTDDTATGDSEEDIYALAANLFGHNTLPVVPVTDLMRGDQVDPNAVYYADLRSIAAKRSVAQNSYAAIVGERVSGPENASGPGDKSKIDYAPYLKKAVAELGYTDIDELNDMLGEQPSYFAQMEVLTKKLYQNPTFYTELYDKPANVARKEATLQAFTTMQNYDITQSVLRSEMVLSVLLSQMLDDAQDPIYRRAETFRR